MDYEKMIEEQFQKDLLSEQIVIEDIQFLDKEEDSFVPATLKLFGYSMIIDIYKDGELWKSSTYKSLGDIEKQIYIVPSSRYIEEVTVCLDDEKVFLMTPEKSEIIREYYNYLNREFINQRIKFKKMIDMKVNKLSDDEDIFLILYNFIGSVFKSTFLDLRMIAGVEHELLRKNKIGEHLMLTKEQVRRDLLVSNERKNGVTVSVTSRLENQDDVNTYLEDFYLLAEGLKRILDIENSEVAIYLTYRLLYRTTIRYFSHGWKKKYYEYFDNIENKTIEEMVVKYVCINTISPDSIGNAAPFVYFLMDRKKFPNNENFVECSGIFVDILYKVLNNKELSLK